MKDFKALVFFNQLSELGVASERLDFLGLDHRTLASDQHQTERKKAIDDFENNRVSLLLTTDIGARGLDFSDLYYVVQYDMSLNAENYVHRSGRVGRMGKSGEVITLVNDRDVRELRKMMRQLDNELSEIFVSHNQIVEEKIVGETEETLTSEKKKKEEATKKHATSRSNQEKPSETSKKKKKNRKNRNKNKGVHWK